MRAALRVLHLVWRGVTWPIRLVRDGESDLEGTYPDRRKPTGEQAAAQASMNTSLTGLGSG